MRGCCAGLSIIVADLLKRYGEHGVRVFIEQVSRQNPESLRLIAAINNVFSQAERSHRTQTTSLKQLIASLASDSDHVSVHRVMFKAHEVVLAHVDGKFYFYDANFGLFIYHTAREMEADVGYILEVGYGVPVNNQLTDKLRVESNSDYIIPELGRSLFDNQLVLLNTSVNDYMASFVNDYDVPSGNQETLEQSARIMSEHNRPLLGGNDFYHQQNNSILELSELFKETLENFDAQRRFVEDEEVEFQRLAYQAFLDRYQHYSERHSRGQPVAVNADADRHQIERMAQALNAWKGKDIPGYKAMNPKLSRSAQWPKMLANRRNTVRYITDHDVFINLADRIENKEVLAVGKAQLIVNLSPDKLLLLYQKMPALLKFPGAEYLIQSLRITALKRYLNSPSPVVFQLTGRGWQGANALKSMLMGIGVVTPDSTWRVDLPGRMNFGHGVYYNELSEAVRGRFNDFQQYLGRTEGGEALTQPRALAYLFADTLHDYLLGRLSADEFLNPGSRLYGESIDQQQLSAFFLGRLRQLGFDDQNLALVSSAKLDWVRKQREFTDNLHAFNHWLLNTSEEAYQAVLSGTQLTWALERKIQHQFPSTLEDMGESDKAVFLSWLGEGRLVSANAMAEFNYLYRDYGYSEQGLGLLVAGNLGFLEAAGQKISQLIHDDFKNLTDAKQVYPLNQSLLARCSGGACLSLARVVAAALDEHGPDGFLQLSKTLNNLVLGDERFESFVQSMRLLQKSATVALKLASIEDRVLGLHNLEDVFLFIEQAAEGGAKSRYHYILETRQHAMLISHVIGDSNRSSYLFFDANVGLAEFDDLDKFQQGLYEFLVDQGYAEHAYDAQLDGEGLPLFKLRLVNAEQMANLTLSDTDQLQLSSLYETDVSLEGGILNREGKVVLKLSGSAMTPLLSDMTSPQRKHFLNDLYLKNNLLTQSETANGFQDQDKLDKFYQDYLVFLKHLQNEYDVNTADAGNYRLQKLVSRLYYYPASVTADAAVDNAKKNGYARWLLMLAESPDIINKRPEYPYITVNAPDEVDLAALIKYRRENGVEEIRTSDYFKSFSLRDGHVDTGTEFIRIRNIINAGRVEFIPPDYHQKIHDVTRISKLVINLNQQRITDLMGFLKRLHKDPLIGHRVLKTSLAGFNYYHLTSEKATVYFSGVGEQFTNDVSDRILSLIEAKGWQQDLLDITPVGMYPLAKGVSYQLDDVDQKISYGIHYQWGAVGSLVKQVSLRLLNLSEPNVLNKLLGVGQENDQLLYLRMLLNPEYENLENNYFNNPALFSGNRVAGVFNEVDFRERLSIIIAKMRALKYHRFADYQQYRQSVDNANSVIFSDDINGALDAYENSVETTDEAMLNNAKRELLQRLTGDISAEQTGALLNYILAGLVRHREVVDANAENPGADFGGTVLLKDQLGSLLGLGNHLCCYQLNLMVASLLKHYGEYGARIFLEQIAGGNKSLLKFIYATSSAANRPPYETYAQRLSVEQVFKALSAEPSSLENAGVMLLYGHSLSVAYQGDRYYVYDSKTAFRRYDTLQEAVSGTQELIEERYDYLSDEQVVLDLSDGLFSVEGNRVLHSELVLLNVSMRDTLHAFVSQYVVPELERHLLGDNTVWPSRTEYRDYLALNNKIISTEKEFVKSLNRPVVPLSVIATQTLEKLKSNQAVLQLESLQTKKEFITQFKNAYIEYVYQHSETNASVDGDRYPVHCGCFEGLS